MVCCSVAAALVWYGMSSNTLTSPGLGLWTEAKEGVKYGVGVTLEVGIDRFPPGLGVRWKE